MRIGNTINPFRRSINRNDRIREGSSIVHEYSSEQIFMFSKLLIGIWFSDYLSHICSPSTSPPLVLLLMSTKSLFSFLDLQYCASNLLYLRPILLKWRTQFCFLTTFLAGFVTPVSVYLFMQIPEETFLSCLVNGWPVLLLSPFISVLFASQFLLY